MSKHTPGPWTIEEYGDEDAPALVIHKDSQARVCFMATPGSYGDPAKIEADARLIAAAPDLLEALKALQIQALQSPDLLKTEWGQEALKMTHAAIAKAMGD